MRMWMVDPRLMCRQHLLGEHVELHMLAGSLRLGKSLQGYLVKGQAVLERIGERHSKLVEEMERRGFNHRSPLRCKKARGGFVDEEASLKELARRCPECRARIEGGSS